MEKFKARWTKPLGFIDKRICAITALVLMFSAMTFAYHAVDQRFAAAGIFAGIMYLLTVFAFVFEDGISTGEEENKKK